MKIMRVGDPHIQVSNLKDSRSLMEFVMKTAMENDIKIIEFLGDLFHTHAVVRLEVLDFWKETFDKIEHLGIECRVLVGNHDQPGSKELEQEMNSINIFQPHDDSSLRFIINRPMIIGGIAYVPYHSDENIFLEACQDLYDQGATGLLVAHQTFTGAQYENGFFSEEGIDPALVPQEQILSGHIHKCQQVGKCFYPGTPKWDTMSDANQEKGIWIFDHDTLTGQYTHKHFISTEEIVTPITSYHVKEGEALPELNSKARNHVVLEGKTAWVNKVKKQLKGLANIKVMPTDIKISSENNNKNITLEEYLDKNFIPIEGVNKNDIKSFIKEME